MWLLVTVNVGICKCGRVFLKPTRYEKNPPP
ncbi:MAG: hypothetical protein ACI9V1_000869, partial [Spirosomataceae bacterium]